MLWVAGTQKNRLNETHVNETVLLNTQNKYQDWWIRKYSQFYAQNFGLSRSTSYAQSTKHLVLFNIMIL